jgi:hypothetical protein
MEERQKVPLCFGDLAGGLRSAWRRRWRTIPWGGDTKVTRIVWIGETSAKCTSVEVEADGMISMEAHFLATVSSQDSHRPTSRGLPQVWLFARAVNCSLYTTHLVRQFGGPFIRELDAVRIRAARHAMC